ncbi:MAG TPA: ATP-binding protein [Kofleriaceae bacterium]|nr:ATP-binding protein [Kofleriaceae bacterium]
MGSIAETVSYTAAERSGLVASPDGAHVAVVEPGRVVILELQRATQVAEIGVVTTPEHTDVAWVGTPPRLIVLSRRTTHSTVHLIDIEGPRVRAEIQIEGMMRLGATVGSHALVIGASSTAVLTAGDAHFLPYQFPGRSIPTVAGAAARLFVVAVPGAIEEWDPQQRSPRKRVRLPRPASITQVGGTERVVWMTTQQEPARIDVIAQVNRAQPKVHELPEPIAQVSAHPQRDLLACLGRDTGSVYIVDLEGRTPLRTLDLEAMNRADTVALFVGPTLGVVAARAGHPVKLFLIDGRPVVMTPALPPPSPLLGQTEPRRMLTAHADGNTDTRPSSLYDQPLAPIETSAPGPVHRLGDPGDLGAPAAAPAGTIPTELVPAFPGEVPPAPAPATGSNGSAVPRSGLASLQLRGIARPSSGPPRLRRLGSEPVVPATPAPKPPTRTLTDAPPALPVVRPPIALAMASLAPRSLPARCSSDEYQALLEQYRRYAATTALRAIAQDWDSGRLAFSTHDRPPFEAEVLGIVGRRSGLAPARTVEAAEALEEATGMLQRARAALTGKLSALDIISAEHGVGTTGELVLLFVAAPSLWGELARLYGILSNDSGRATCDEHLLWQLLGHLISRREIAREIDPDSPLIHHGLIRTSDRGRPFQALSADPIVIKLLSGSTIDDDLEHGVVRVPAAVPLDQLMIPPRVIDRALADLVAAPPSLARVVVTGRSGSGRRTMLATLAELAGRTLATIDAAMLIREKRVGDLAGLLQHAHLRGWLACVDGLDTIASDDAATRGSVKELLRDHHGPLAVRLPRHVQPPLEPGYVLIELPTSTIAERAAQWKEILTGANLAVRDVDELAARFTVGPGTIRNVVTTVARGAPPDADHAVETALRQYLETKLGAVATRVTRLANWSQIVLPADIHDSIVELVARIRHRRTVYDTWGFDQVMSTSRGLTALFQGGPGTGKTLVASAIANELGLDLYRIDLSRVMSKWIGETEQNLAKVFDAAEEGQALILFDEADSLFGKRTEVRTSVDRYANLETNYLLQRLDSFEGVAVLTTNFGTAIDAAFKRRLSVRLTFPFPDEEARERLWRVHLPEQLPLAGKLDLADLARRYKMSGGYIRNAALRAAFLAAEEQAPLSQDHLERAVRAEFREGGKLAESGFLE